MSNGINSPYGIQIVSSAIGNGGTQKLTPYSIYASTNGQSTLSSSIFSGDPVCWSTAAAAANPPAKGTGGTIIPLWAIGDAAAQAATPILGVFQFCNYWAPNNIWVENSPYWPASQQIQPDTTIVAYINDDPDVVCRAQISTSTNEYADIVFLFKERGTNACLSIGGVNITDHIPVGYVVAQNPAAGNTNIGTSAYYINGSTINTAGGDAVAIEANRKFNVKIIDLASAVGGQIGGTPPNSVIIQNLIPGVNMPFVDLLFKFNNHVYGSTGTPSPILA